MPAYKQAAYKINHISVDSVSHTVSLNNAQLPLYPCNIHKLNHISYELNFNLHIFYVTWSTFLLS